MDHLVPSAVAHTSVSVHTGWEEARDEIVESVEEEEEEDRLDAGTFAAPGRCRNSCASAPPYVMEEDGHARVVVEVTARDRCRSS